MTFKSSFSLFPVNRILDVKPVFRIRFLFYWPSPQFHLHFFDDEKRRALLSTTSVCAIRLPPVPGFWVCVKSKGKGGWGWGVSIKVDKSYLFLGRYFQS